MIGTASLEQWELDSQYVTQLRAENAELKQQRDELLAALESARNRIVDMLQGDDGQAWKEAQKAMPSIEATIASVKAKP